MSASIARELLAAGAVGAVYLAIFAAAELWRQWRRPPVEWTRKAVHTAGGLVALSFPWLFQSVLTVLALAAAFALLLWATRRFGLLQSVHGVERRSEGGLYYPIAIFLLFALGRGRPVFYLVSLLALVLADALAAVLGAAYGRLTFQVEDDRRSLEGSAVFFLVTFLGAHLPLLLLTPIGRVESVLLAAQLALLVTLVEAVSLRGNDNLLVPIGCYYLLVKMTPKAAEVLAFQLASQLVILAVLIWFSRRSRLLTLSGTLTASLFFYGAFSLGGEEWTLAPAAALLLFLAVFRGAISAAPAAPAPDRRYQVLAVFYSAVAAAALVVLNNTFETLIPGAGVLASGDPFYPLYVGALAGQLAVLVHAWSGGGRSAWASLAAGLAGVVPLGMLAGVARGEPGAWAMAAGTACLAVALYRLAERRRAERPAGGVGELRLQAACVAVAVLIVLPLQLARAGAWGGAADERPLIQQEAAR